MSKQGCLWHSDMSIYLYKITYLSGAKPNDFQCIKGVSQCFTVSMGRSKPAFHNLLSTSAENSLFNHQD